MTSEPRRFARCTGGMKRVLLPVLLALVAVCLLAASHASAKEGVVARVLTPIDRDTPPPETKVTVVWTLLSVEDGKRHPFGGGDVFIQLFGPGTFRSRRVSAAPIRPGRYRAAVGVPRYSARRHWADGYPLRPERLPAVTPLLFRIVGDPLRP